MIWGIQTMELRVPANFVLKDLTYMAFQLLARCLQCSITNFNENLTVIGFSLGQECVPERVAYQYTNRHYFIVKFSSATFQLFLLTFFMKIFSSVENFPKLTKIFENFEKHAHLYTKICRTKGSQKGFSTHVYSIFLYPFCIKYPLGTPLEQDWME